MADNTRRLAGVAELYIGGTSYKVADAVTWQPSIKSRKSMVGMTGWAGYSEENVAGMISFTLYDAHDLSVSDLNEFTNVDILVIAANGKSVAGNGMFNTDALKVSGKDGTFECVFEGPEVRDVLA